MTELQQKLFDILKEVVRVCDENNIAYYLFAGSCLGAIRHKGFIPWDDDIDIAMPRKDYDKFIKLQDKFPKNMFIQTYHSDKHFYYNYCRVRNSDTTFIQKHFVNHDINAGCWVDVFPLDGAYKKAPKNLKIFAPNVMLYWFHSWLMYPNSLHTRIRKESTFLDIVQNFVAGLFFPLNCFNWMNHLMDKIIQRKSYDKCEIIGNYCGLNPKKEAMPKKFFGEPVYGEFEGLKVKLPSDWDGYLKHYYGDYMTPPPVEKQIPHHYNFGVDLTMGFEEYRKQKKANKKTR